MTSTPATAPGANTPDTAPDTATLAASLDATLGGQLQRLRRRYLVHGAAYVVAALAGTTVIYFALDRLLLIPSAVRVLVSLGVLGYLLATARRRVLYPLRRDIVRTDMALVIEHRFPELRQQLVSAWQLQDQRDTAGPDGPRNMSPAMIDRTVRGAVEQLRSLPLREVLNPRRTLRVWAVAATLAVVFGVVAVGQTEDFGVFLRRAFGSGLAYPRATQLEVLLQEDEDLRVVRPSAGVAEVTLASGGDLPVRVRAVGEIPRKVTLVLDGARGLPPEVEASPRRARPDVFAFTFRRIRGSFSFHARGGDDPDGDLLVRVTTVDPPLVGTVETELTYPAYTGREAERRSGGAIEALVGTEVVLDVTTTAPVDEATLHFLDDGTELPLEPTALDDDSGAASSFRGRFQVSASDRYEIHLRSPAGLRNPRPGSYPIVALEDLQPVGTLLLPDGGDVHVAVPGALIPVRLQAEDDFGLGTIQLIARLERADDGVITDLLAGVNGDATGPGGEAQATAGPPPRKLTRTLLFDTAALAGVGPAPTAGDTVALEVILTDNRVPEASATKLAPRPVYLVDLVELQRRVASHFRRVREEVERSLELQRARADDLAVLMETPPTAGRGRSTELIALEVGQGRILQSARRVHESVMAAYDVHLFNGLEGADSLQVPATQQLYVEVLSASDEPRARLPEFYRRLGAEQAEGRIGAMEKVLDPILSMVLRADRLAEDLATPAVRQLEATAVASTDTEIVERLQRVAAVQTQIAKELETLLGQLDEWNELQDVVQQARALRDAQRNVERETESLREGDREDTPGRGR